MYHRKPEMGRPGPTVWPDPGTMAFAIGRYRGRVAVT